MCGVPAAFCDTETESRACAFWIQFWVGLSSVTYANSLHSVFRLPCVFLAVQSGLSCDWLLDAKTYPHFK